MVYNNSIVTNSNSVEKNVGFNLKIDRDQISDNNQKYTIFSIEFILILLLYIILYIFL